MPAKLAKYNPDDVIWDRERKEFGIILLVVGDNTEEDDNLYEIIWTTSRIHTEQYDISAVDDSKRYRRVGNLSQCKTLMDRVNRSGLHDTIRILKSVK